MKMKVKDVMDDLVNDDLLPLHQLHIAQRLIQDF